jgi:hypothetical protein
MGTSTLGEDFGVFRITQAAGHPGAAVATLLLEKIR